MRLLLFFIATIFLASCNNAIDEKPIGRSQYSNGSYKFNYMLKDGMLEDSLICWKDDSILFFQLWKNGQLVSTSIRREQTFEKIMYKCKDGFFGRECNHEYSDGINANFSFLEKPILSMYNEFVSTKRTLSSEGVMELEVLNVPSSIFEVYAVNCRLKLINGVFLLAPSTDTVSTYKVWIKDAAGYGNLGRELTGKIVNWAE